MRGFAWFPTPLSLTLRPTCRQRIMETTMNIRKAFWLSYFGFVALCVTAAFAALIMAGCDSEPERLLPPTWECDTDDPMADGESGTEDGPWEPATKFDVPEPPDYCEAFGEPDPGFVITVTSEDAVFTATACQGKYASCSITGVDTVTMWCDFPCGETRSMTIETPDAQGVYEVTFPNPCAQEAE